jgi:hypothetical protein
LGKGQGHEHGECDVARRVCGHDCGAPGAGGGALLVLGLGITHAGVVEKQHEDPMFVGANLKSEGQKLFSCQLCHQIHRHGHSKMKDRKAWTEYFNQMDVAHCQNNNSTEKL